MKIKFLTRVVLTLGFMLVLGCKTPDTSDKPWDRPTYDNSGSGYSSPYSFQR